MSQYNTCLYSENPKANIANQWDFGFLKDTLKQLDSEFKSVDNLPKTDKAIVVIPARHNAEKIDEINKELSKINHVVLFLMGDEEADFPVEKIEHPSIHIWVQNPHMGRHDKYNKLGTGYPMHMHDNLPDKLEKVNDVYFSGQVTHQRREELMRVLDTSWSVDILANATTSFTAGASPKEYYLHMTQAKIAPAPSGAVIPDSFRMFEALECMSIVVADTKTANGEVMQYWDWLFDTAVPFPQLQDWNALVGIANTVLEDYDNLLHKQTAWWLQYKRNVKHKILEQLHG